MALADSIHAHLLWIAVAWPLLLAAPWVGIRDSWLCYLAILPAAILAIWPSDVSLALPQFLLGTSLAVKGQTHWILAMSVIIWLVAASAFETRLPMLSFKYARPLFLLTAMGNIGAIVSADLVSFFIFSAVMGYSFYGLFTSSTGYSAGRVGLVYLIFLIFADQSLFEAMLTAAMHTDNLSFAAVRHAMGNAPHAQTYMLFALIAFSLKAGIWPAHWWLPAGYRSASRPVAVLMSSVPVSTGLLGAVRFLPIGEFSSYALGMAVQVLGIAAILYGTQRLLRCKSGREIPAWSVIFGTGILVAFIGRALVVPTDWGHYGYWALPYIATLGFFGMALTLVADALWKKPSHPVPQTGLEMSWLMKRQLLLFQTASQQKLVQINLWWDSMRLHAAVRYQQVIERVKSGLVSGIWATAIVTFVVIGLFLAWLSA